MCVFQVGFPLLHTVDLDKSEQAYKLWVIIEIVLIARSHKRATPLMTDFGIQQISKLCSALHCKGRN